MIAYVIEKLCICCGRCLSACPRQALSLAGGVAKVNPSLCIGCEECLENCMHGSITFVDGE